MDTKKIEKVLRNLTELQSNHEISIIKISEPILSAIPQDGNGVRTSDVSNSSMDAPTPASLEADLAHYKELFAKLRFSYVEQVTKEKFIRAIVGDPPLIVSPQENIELEKENVAAKGQLKALKMEVADMVEELEKKGRDLSKRYENVKLETTTLKELPAKIAHLEDRIAELKEAQEPGENPSLSLPLSKTLELVEEKKRQKHELDRQLEQLQSQVPRKRKEMERLQAELQPLEVKRQNSTAAAKEAKRRKEAALGGVEDDLEERGRWWRASETLLKQMLDIRS
ncbi:putative 60s ribosomal protein l37 protein [Phaeoacremonium minimum UCRPA7]|uniref:Putative 60s ribosomal protein l37 protein n=1 Tax=Phaeoacremonium minimum (strain UCR-PA7) TaxID=1286976 RepID=R8BR41_PHAM7|nr:putative 60s ribosomal protein l37 protein [Phaeoacremonium minimum UCRPA7]EOO01838.1 putative 60s ribosomal protein l37 protein [Phaeoacremonium minimum UCRPA7]